MSGRELVQLIKKQWSETYIVCLAEDINTEEIDEFYSAGCSDIFFPSYNKSTLHSILTRASADSKRFQDKNNIIKSMEESESKYFEQATILQTILDILSHDTKNLFMNIQGLIHQLPENANTRMLIDTVEELYQLTCEAMGYLGSKKRIYSFF